MKRKYVIHPGDYAIGENEKLYADMAAKGWLLEKRGGFLSRFRRDVPQKLRYRLELAPSDMFDMEREFPEEQRELYEDAGWSYVAGNVYIHIFSAPEGSDAPELHTDPRQQAVTLTGLRRKYFFGWIPAAVILLLDLLPLTIGGKGFGHIAGMFGMQWIADTAFMTLFALLLIWSAYGTLHGALHIARLRRSLKRGRPIDHAPKNRQRLHRTVNAVLLICCIFFIILSIIQLAQSRKYEMPSSADGPYMLLRNVGWDGERTTGGITDLTSYVKTKHSLLADQWHTYECVAAGYGSSWMYQDVYELRGIVPPGIVVSLLMANSTFTRHISDYVRVDVPGFDEAYESQWEYIAVRGNTIYRITYSEPGIYTSQGVQADVLQVLAEMDR